MKAVVVALGDLLRSPRACYHAQAFASAGYDVSLIGEISEPLHIEGVQVISIPSWSPSWRTLLPQPLYVGLSAARTLPQSAFLTQKIISLRPNVVLVQTPPAIPTLHAAALACRTTGASLIIDWHNISASILALRLGPDHAAVKAIQKIEQQAARWECTHLAVTQALANQLKTLGCIGPVVLRDHPAAQFQTMSAEERKRARQELADELQWTELANNDELPLVMTASSYTLDDDFAMLLSALAQREQDKGPPLALLATGRGEGRAQFETAVQRLHLKRTTFRTAWLSADNYARALETADAGLSLHRSSSGFDFPMKIVDMLGAGLPVLALDEGAALRETLHEDRNAIFFNSAEQLAMRLNNIASPAGVARLSTLRQSMTPQGTWEEDWRRVVPSLLAASA